MRNGIVHHKSDRKLCVIPTAGRNRGCPYFYQTRTMLVEDKNWDPFVLRTLYANTSDDHVISSFTAHKTTVEPRGRAKQKSGSYHSQVYDVTPQTKWFE